LTDVVHSAMGPSCREWELRREIGMTEAKTMTNETEKRVCPSCGRHAHWINESGGVWRWRCGATTCRADSGRGFQDDKDAVYRAWHHPEHAALVVELQRDAAAVCFTIKETEAKAMEARRERDEQRARADQAEAERDQARAELAAVKKDRHLNAPSEYVKTLFNARPLDQIADLARRIEALEVIAESASEADQRLADRVETLSQEIGVLVSRAAESDNERSDLRRRVMGLEENENETMASRLQHIANETETEMNDLRRLGCDSDSSSIDAQEKVIADQVMAATGREPEPQPVGLERSCGTCHYLEKMGHESPCKVFCEANGVPFSRWIPKQPNPQPAAFMGEVPSFWESAATGCWIDSPGTLFSDCAEYDSEQDALTAWNNWVASVTADRMAHGELGPVIVKRVAQLIGACGGCDYCPSHPTCANCYHQSHYTPNSILFGDDGGG
jgi:hypothetical protein